jgi:hypothetical protein
LSTTLYLALPDATLSKASLIFDSGITSTIGLMPLARQSPASPARTRSTHSEEVNWRRLHSAHHSTGAASATARAELSSE